MVFLALFLVTLLCAGLFIYLYVFQAVHATVASIVKLTLRILHQLCLQE